MSVRRDLPLVFTVKDTVSEWNNMIGRILN